MDCWLGSGLKGDLEQNTMALAVSCLLKKKKEDSRHQNPG